VEFRKDIVYEAGDVQKLVVKAKGKVSSLWVLAVCIQSVIQLVNIPPLTIWRVQLCLVSADLNHPTLHFYPAATFHPPDLGEGASDNYIDTGL